MLTKITRSNANGEKVETVIDLSFIDGMTEKKVAPTKLYDANGVEVSSQENESVYEIHFNNDRKIIVEKDTYDKLCQALKVQTL